MLRVEHATTWRGSSYSDDPAQALEDIALRAAVEQLLELRRGQRAGRRLAGIAGIAGGFEGEVAGCGEGPVSEVRRMHGSAQSRGGRPDTRLLTRLHVEQICKAGDRAQAGRSSGPAHTSLQQARDTTYRLHGGQLRPESASVRLLTGPRWKTRALSLQNGSGYAESGKGTPQRADL